MLISNTICHQGLVRDQNEDSYISNSDEGIWLVADGVGGNVGGHIASQISVQTVERKLRQGSSLLAAINAANQAVLSAATQQSDLNGMATTIVATKFFEDRYELAWVGDSRAYLIDAENIYLLSSDHNVANELYLEGKITEQERQVHPGQHELTQALGHGVLTEVPVKRGVLNHNAILLLCSDGLSGVLSDELIFKTVKNGLSLKHISQALLDLVLKSGAPDNVTISLIQYVDEDSESGMCNVEKPSPSTLSVKHKNRVKNKAALTWGVLFITILIMVLLVFMG
jgi:protein phosphatase